MIISISGRRILGLFTLFLIIAIPAISQAVCEATLEWDPSSPVIEGFYVFGREEGQQYDYEEPWWQGDNTFSSCTIDGLNEDKTYFFVIRAYSGNAVSPDSNEVRYSYESVGNTESINEDNSASLSNDGTSGGSSGSFYGSSSGCFLNSIFGSK
jgi:hypothetical protein